MGYFLKRNVMSNTKYEKIADELLTEMFKRKGRDFVKERPTLITSTDWFKEEQFTKEENKSWKAWGEKLLVEKHNFPPEMAKKEMDFFDLMYGWSMSDDWKKEVAEGRKGEK